MTGDEIELSRLPKAVKALEIKNKVAEIDVLLLKGSLNVHVAIAELKILGRLKRG